MLRRWPSVASSSAGTLLPVAPSFQIKPKTTTGALACFAFLAVAAIPPAALSQTYEWTWMSGSPLSAYSGQSGIYGTLDTPAPGNAPGSRRGAVSWTDSHGNFWLFGGNGYDSAGYWGNLNDLWEFSPASNQWTWVGGSSVLPGTPTLPTGPVGIYGQLGTPAQGNVPGARVWASGWTDNDGNLWLFGGQGFDSSGYSGNLNDLWEFNPSTGLWAWMAGSSTLAEKAGVPGVYGTLGKSAAGDVPGSRFGAVSWTDAAGNLWLFGGDGFDSASTQAQLNDLWLFIPSTGEWTWMGGSSTVSTTLLGMPGVYGTLGQFASGNFPGSRYWATAWTDKSGNLWLFGGSGFGSNEAAYVDNGDLNDLWEFKPSSHQWAWMGGSANAGGSQSLTIGLPELPGVYGSLQTPAAGNAPGGRYGSAGWSDARGNFWVFGGVGLDSINTPGYLNDLWQFNPSTLEWTWMGGSNTVPVDCAFDDNQEGFYGFCGDTGVYGSLRIPAFGSDPGGRDMSATWKDAEGNFWLMGGQGYDSAAYGDLNDLWELSAASFGLPVAATPSITPQSGSINTWQDVTISDTTSGAAIFFTVNGSTASQYTGPITVTSSETIQAIAAAPGFANSNTAIASYTANFPQAAPPTFSVADGTYSSAQTVALSDTTPGASIYYATYTVGPAPTAASTLYTGPITVSSSVSIVAIAVAPNYLNSVPTVALYTIWPKPTLGEWAWMGGSTTLPSCPANTGVCASVGVYGTLGSPASGNVPGGRLGAVTWTGADGRLWLFGGNGRDSNGNIGYYNDVWVYDPSTTLWTWMGGSSTFVSSSGGWGRPGIYGALGQPSSANIPGGRDYASGWTGPDGHLWLFGGQGFDSNGTWGALNDMWEFNPSTRTWTWVSGQNTVLLDNGASGVYGTLGIPASSNTPGSRYQAQTWTGKDGRFWLYGGNGSNLLSSVSCTNNDMWVFDPSTRLWTWMLGLNVCNDGYAGYLPVYGTLSVPASGNNPWNLAEAVTWTDKNGILWMFGGIGEYIDGTDFYINEIWAYDPSVNEWAWMGGGNTVPSFGTQGVWNPDNLPGSTYDAVGWTDKNGKFWLFGGWTVEDSSLNGAALSILWQLDPSTDEWVWMNGSDSFANLGWEPGLYGAIGSPGVAYTPGGRAEAMSWTDANGNLWLFGGRGVDAVGGFGFLNDLWEFQSSLGVAPGSLNITAPPTFNPVQGIYLSVQSVTISDATAGAIIYYTTDGSVPTTASTVYTSPIPVSTTEVINAIAIAPNDEPSSEAQATYNLVLPAAGLPSFSVPSGTYTSTQTVIISDTTPGASIYYTTDGTTPTTTSPQYTAPIAVSKTETINAIAVASGYSASAVASASYIINLTPPTISISGTAVTLSPGASTGNTSTITLTPTGGFIGSITLTAVITSSPNGAQDLPTLSFGSTSPVNITSTNAATATLTISTTAATSAAVAHSKRPGVSWLAMGGATLGCILLFGTPTRRRRRQSMLGMLMLLVTLTYGILACGGGGSTGGGGTSNPGTTAGTYTVTVTGTSGATTGSGTATLTVQ